ncbi:MAG: nuclear transport factor 2 family protein [Deltaproteobacteria bacterium]|nr:nuclear transport factor 2 family protein [Deltaproteobacteria bacterium]
MRADEETEKEVLEVIRESWDAYIERDIDRLLSHYTDDPDLVAIGTSKGEKYFGPEQVRKAFEKELRSFCPAKMELLWASVSRSGDVAWVAGEFIAQVDTLYSPISMTGRMTCVLEKRNGKWYIMHTHFSFA